MLKHTCYSASKAAVWPKYFFSLCRYNNLFLTVHNLRYGDKCTLRTSSFQANYDGQEIPLPFNLEILKWSNETHEILSRAKVPSQVKFYNIYGTNLETPHSVW